jgi:hypothetical protein
MDRKEIARQYRETPRPAGVYRVVHRPTGRTLLGASVDAPAMLNRIRAQLGMQRHPNRQLQSDWDADGEAGFEFEVLDRLTPPGDPSHDMSDDLEILHDLWREKLQVEMGLTY